MTFGEPLIAWINFLKNKLLYYIRLFSASAIPKEKVVTKAFSNTGTLTSGRDEIIAARRQFEDKLKRKQKRNAQTEPEHRSTVWASSLARAYNRKRAAKDPEPYVQPKRL